MLQPVMGPPTPAKPLLPHPAKACQGCQWATGHAATAGPCGASTPSRVAAQPRQIHQSGAKPEPGELQELQLGAWPSSPLESVLAAAACRVGSRGENQREDVQWLGVGGLEPWR